MIGESGLHAQRSAYTTSAYVQLNVTLIPRADCGEVPSRSTWMASPMMSIRTRMVTGSSSPSASTSPRQVPSGSPARMVRIARSLRVRISCPIPSRSGRPVSSRNSATPFFTTLLEATWAIRSPDDDVGDAHVRTDEAHEFRILPSGSEEERRRDDETFLVDVARVAREDPPPDVGRVGAARGEADESPSSEEGRDHGVVVELRRPEPRIVREQHVARAQGRGRIALEKRLHLGGHHPEERDLALARLGDEVAARVEEGVREVVRVGHVAREGGALEGHCALVHDGEEPVPPDSDLGGVEGDARPGHDSALGVRSPSVDPERRRQART